MNNKAGVEKEKGIEIDSILQDCVSGICYTGSGFETIRIQSSNIWKFITLHVILLFTY